MRWPVRVSIFSLSSSRIYSGTWTTYPVSMVTDLVAPWAVLPAAPGSHWVMPATMKFGRSMTIASPRKRKIDTSRFSTR